VLGSPGQASHTAASAALDAFMAGRGTTIDWAAWAGKGAAVTHGADERLAAIGVGTIDSTTAFRALERSLEPGLDRMVVLPIDWSAFKAATVPPVLAELVLPAHAEAGPSATPVAPGPPRIGDIDALRQQVAQACARLLPPGQPIDLRRALTDQGLDSLGALELRNRLGQLVGARLSATILFDCPNVEALTTCLAGHLDLMPSDPAPAASPVAMPMPDDDPGGLDDNELDAALARFERMLAEDDA
jgi:polyketide synthase 12